jgi:hypothetical protein
MKLRRLYRKKIYEIKKTAQNMKEEINKDMENLRKRIKQKSQNKKFLKSNKKYN